MKWEEAANGLKDIGNQFSMSLGKILFDAASGLPDPAMILEIGAFQGFSTCALAYACVNTQRRVMTIDTFHGNIKNTDLQDGESYYGTFLDNVRARNLQEYIMPLVGRSEIYYDGWAYPLDLLFIDGCHPIMQQDLDAFFPHLKAGGMLLMHDVADDNETWRGVKEQLTDVHLFQNLGWGKKRGDIEALPRTAL